MIKTSAVALIASLFVALPSIAQDTTDAEIAELRAQLLALTARLDELEQREAVRDEVVAQVTVTPPPSQRAGGSATWPDRIQLSGDLRYRHETINDDIVSFERHRQRIRARIGLTANVTDDLTVGFRLSSGGDNPISGNQSLDNGFSRKDIGFDRAFFEWDVTDSIAIRGGKMGNPFFRPGGHHLIYDSDLNPEGLALRYSSGSFFANAAGFFVEERGTDEDSTLMAAQAGYRGSFGNGTEITAGLSYYDFRNTQGTSPIFVGLGLGNSLDPSGNFLFDFNEIEAFVEVGFDIGGQPLTLFADYVKNTEADQYDTAHAVGLQYRDASDPGSWELAWAYQDLEADAVYALFTDSDFGGGGTDNKSHVFTTNYVFRERWNLGLKYFLGERGEAAGFERDYKRVQADISFRY